MQRQPQIVKSGFRMNDLRSRICFVGHNEFFVKHDFAYILNITSSSEIFEHFKDQLWMKVMVINVSLSHR